MEPVAGNNEGDATKEVLEQLESKIAEWQEKLEETQRMQITVQNVISDLIEEVKEFKKNGSELIKPFCCSFFLSALPVPLGYHLILN